LRLIPLADLAARRQYWRGPQDQEDDMAKGQMKSNKETKKPKAEKPKGTVSAYKQSQGKGGQAPIGSTGKK
jgi:hypothetical protein